MNYEIFCKFNYKISIFWDHTCRKIFLSSLTIQWNHTSQPYVYLFLLGVCKTTRVHIFMCKHTQKNLINIQLWTIMEWKMYGFNTLDWWKRKEDFVKDFTLNVINLRFEPTISHFDFPVFRLLIVQCRYAKYRFLRWDRFKHVRVTNYDSR